MKTLVFAIVMTLSFVAFGHGDHPKPIAKCASACTKPEIEAAVPAALGSLALAGKISPDWSQGKVESLELKDFSKGKEWVATVSNPSKGAQKLYVFITKDGYLNGSNFTGK